MVAGEIVDLVRGALRAMLGSVGSTSSFLAALLVVFLGWWVSKKAVKYAGRPISLWLRRPSLVKTALRGLRISIFLFSILLALSILGVELTGLLVSMGVASAIVAVVIAPFVSSWISGFFILIDRPYEVGDMVSIRDPDVTGFVREITMRYTKLTTMDNSSLVIPNQSMREKDVVNYSADDLRLRRSLTVDVSYDSDLDEAEEALMEAARNTEDVIDYPGKIRLVSATYTQKPRVFVESFAESGVRLTLTYWIEKPYYQRGVATELAKNVDREFEERDVEIPYPHRQLVFEGEKPERDTLDE